MLKLRNFILKKEDFFLNLIKKEVIKLLKKEDFMRNKKTHSLTFKKKLNKSKSIFRAYNELQLKYGEELDSNDDIVEIKSNVLLEDFELGDNFTSDFVCIKTNGELMVIECVYKKNLLKPMTIKLLDGSYNYWKNKGVDDWRLVLDA